MEWREAVRQPFPEAWRAILEREVGFYRQFDPAKRARFEEQVKLFVLTKEFVGRDGMIVDDTVKLVVAATASRLSVNLLGDHYGRLRFITIWPGAIHTEDEGVIGTAQRNKVVLSWKAVRRGLDISDDGENVAYHEFAHVLDAADGSVDGTPLFVDPTLYDRWAKVMDEEFQQLQAAKREGMRTLLDSYGASSKAEFFSVATETFFERPRAMRLHHPKLYQLLSDYFQQDPFASASPDEPSDPLIGTPDPTRRPQPAKQANHEPVGEALPPGLVRRALHEASQIASDGPTGSNPKVQRGAPQRIDLKDPDAWQPKDIVRLVGGLLMAVALVVFLVPSGDNPYTSELWSRLQGSGHFGWTGLLLLAAGILLLGIGSLMRRDE
jgi:hypothetical protein